MDKSIDILDFDDCYHNQSYYKHTEHKEISLTDFKNVSRYCDSLTLEELDRRIKKLKRSSVTYIGNGNYHYITYLLTNEIKSPFTLIVFDHHTDMMKSPDEEIISCGSWILNALEKNDYLKKVIVVGVSDELSDTVPERFRDRVSVIAEKEVLNYCELLKRLEGELATKDVYISIDKDVLDFRDASTNWDQGTLRLSDLINIIKAVYSEKNVCGIDVCGEYEYSPAEEFSRRVIEANRKNDGANEAILSEIENI